MKFIHTVGAIGVTGSMACFIAMLAHLPDPSATEVYAITRIVMGRIADWIFLPSLILTLAGGLLAITINRAFQDVGWVWIKLALGLIVFEGGLTAIHGPMRREATLSVQVLSEGLQADKLGVTFNGEWIGLWIMFTVAIVNIVLGIWRPQFRWT